MGFELAAPPAAYRDWLMALKARLERTRLRASVAVNEALLTFYWELGAEIVDKQRQAQWGSKFLARLSTDLLAAFPEMRGFSKRNLELMRQWHLYWRTGSGEVTDKRTAIAKQAVSQLPNACILRIPWGHNLVIVRQCTSHEEAAYYVTRTLQHGWSRSVLTHQIESGQWQREGRGLSNFDQTLPTPQSDLARQVLKDPYIFDFLSLTPAHTERELEQSLIRHLTAFLLELGAGFAYVGQQVPLEVGERDFFLDLLFYHTRLHCYVVVELKTVDFEPEHAGKLNFYLKAVDEQLRHEGDGPSIGILLCKTRDKTVVEYALSDVYKPIGVSEYKLTRDLPEALRESLPTWERLEAELRDEVDDA